MNLGLSPAKVRSGQVMTMNLGLFPGYCQVRPVMTRTACVEGTHVDTPVPLPRLTRSWTGIMTQ